MTSGSGRDDRKLGQSRDTSMLPQFSCGGNHKVYDWFSAAESCGDFLAGPRWLGIGCKGRLILVGPCQHVVERGEQREVAVIDGFRQRLLDLVVARNEGGVDPAHGRRAKEYQYRGDYYAGPVWQGRDGRMYCRRKNGTTGLIVGAAAGALIGRAVDGGRNRTTGTIVGAAAGALLGREVDRGARCR